MYEILKIVIPKRINCDKGSEFISSQFKDVLKKYNVEVQYIDITNHTKLGIIDRFVRTLRDMISKYMTVHETSNYIDALPDLIDNYNTSFHKGIQTSPDKVKQRDKDIFKLTQQRFIDAKNDEVKYNIGDNVRFKLKRSMFQKGNPIWSKNVHKIIGQNQHSYILDNNNSYMYYDLQPTHTVEITKTITKPTTTREALRKQNKINQLLKREDILSENIINTKRIRTRPIRHYA